MSQIPHFWNSSIPYATQTSETSAPSTATTTTQSSPSTSEQPSARPLEGSVSQGLAQTATYNPPVVTQMQSFIPVYQYPASIPLANYPILLTPAQFVSPYAPYPTPPVIRHPGFVPYPFTALPYSGFAYPTATTITQTASNSIAQLSANARPLESAPAARPSDFEFSTYEPSASGKLMKTSINPYTQRPTHALPPSLPAQTITSLSSEFIDDSPKKSLIDEVILLCPVISAEKSLGTTRQKRFHSQVDTRDDDADPKRSRRGESNTMFVSEEIEKEQSTLTAHSLEAIIQKILNVDTTDPLKFIALEIQSLSIEEVAVVFKNMQGIHLWKRTCILCSLNERQRREWNGLLTSQRFTVVKKLTSPGHRDLINDDLVNTIRSHGIWNFDLFSLSHVCQGNFWCISYLAFYLLKNPHSAEKIFEALDPAAVNNLFSVFIATDNNQLVTFIKEIESSAPGCFNSIFAKCSSRHSIKIAKNLSNATAITSAKQGLQNRQQPFGEEITKQIRSSWSAKPKKSQVVDFSKATPSISVSKEHFPMLLKNWKAALQSHNSAEVRKCAEEILSCFDENSASFIEQLSEEEKNALLTSLQITAYEKGGSCQIGTLNYNTRIIPTQQVVHSASPTSGKFFFDLLEISSNPEDALSDVTLVVGRQLIYAHSAILSQINYFKECLKISPEEMSRGVFLPETSYAIFLHLLEYIYTRTLPSELTLEQYCDLLHAVNLLSFETPQSDDEVLNALGMYVKNEIYSLCFNFRKSSSNIFRLYKHLSERPSSHLPHLREEVLSHLSKNWAQLQLNSSGFIELSEEGKKAIHDIIYSGLVDFSISDASDLNKHV